MAEISFSKATTAPPPIDVESKVEVTTTTTVPTPVPGVSVETSTTVAAPVAPVVAAPVAPVVDSTPAASIPTAPVAPPVSQSVVVATSVAVSPNDPTRLDDDNIGFEDIILPRINIVQKVGDLSNIFNHGEIVLNQSVVIHEPAFIHPSDPSQNALGTGPLIISVLGFRPRQFTEKVPGGKLGMLLNNEADIAKNNGTLDYKEWNQSVEASKLPGGAPAKRLFQRLATALLLVQKPASLADEEHLLFPYECEGAYYALALWSMKGTAYTHAAKAMFTARKIGHLRASGYVGCQWSLTSKLEDFNGNFAFVPVIKPAAKNTDGFKKFALETIGAGK